MVLKSVFQTQHKVQEVNISELFNPLIQKQQHKLSNIYACEGEGGSLDQCIVPFLCHCFTPHEVTREKKYIV